MPITIEERLQVLETASQNQAAAVEGLALRLDAGDLKAADLLQRLADNQLQAAEIGRVSAQQVTELQKRINDDVLKINASIQTQTENNQSYLDKFLEIDRVLATVQDGYSKQVQLMRGGLGFNVQAANVPNYSVLSFDGTAFVECGARVESVTLPAAQGVKNGRLVIIRGNYVGAVDVFSLGEKDVFIRKLQAVGRAQVSVPKNAVLMFAALGSRGVWFEV